MFSSLTASQLACLRLARTTGLGPVKFHALLTQYGNAIDAVKALQSQGRIILADNAILEAERCAVQSLGATQIFWGDEAYPPLLKHIPDAPVVLTCLGNTALLHTRQVAVVGTRTASAIGQKFTRDLAQQLAQQGYTVTSGLARGVDAAAHTGALQAEGHTIAVLGGGVDHIYPPENKPLYQTIAERGCIISEEAIGGEVAKHNFLRRNRLISGMSLVVVVAEGAERSGSMVTARLALDQGRELFAVPGHPTEPRASGPNALIENGEARLLRSPQALLDMLATLPDPHRFTPVMAPFYPARPCAVSLHDDEPAAPVLATAQAPVEGQSLLSLLSTHAITVDALMRVAGMDEATLSSALTTLELEGTLTRLPGGRVALTSKYRP